MTDNVPELHIVERPADPQWVDMPLSRQIARIVENCSRELAVGLVVTGVGCGKTSALRRCADDVPNVVMVTLTPATGSLRGGLGETLNALAAHHAFGYVDDRHTSPTNSASVFFVRILDTLRRFWRRQVEEELPRIPVLVIDEAQAACAELLDSLRSLYDRNFCSLVISGNHNFRPDGLDALLSRVTYEINRPAPAAEDVNAFCRAHGLMAPRSRQLLRQVAAVRGIRGVRETLRRARAGGEDTLSPAAIEAAVRSMRFLPEDVWERQRGGR